jgi:hypothetical protein
MNLIIHNRARGIPSMIAQQISGRLKEGIKLFVCLTPEPMSGALPYLLVDFS